MEEPVELARPGDPEGDVGHQAGRGEDDLDSVQWDELPDEECVEGTRGRGAGCEEPVVGADEADGHPVGSQPEPLGKERGLRLRIGNDEVGGAECVAVDRGERRRGAAAVAEPPAVGDEGVVQGDERVEDHRPTACDAAGGEEVEVARVSDEHRVGVAPVRAGARARRGQGALPARPRATSSPAPARRRGSPPRRPPPLPGARRSPARFVG